MVIDPCYQRPSWTAESLESESLFSLLETTARSADWVGDLHVVVHGDRAFGDAVAAILTKLTGRARPLRLHLAAEHAMVRYLNVKAKGVPYNETYRYLAEMYRDAMGGGLNVYEWDPGRFAFPGATDAARELAPAMWRFLALSAPVIHIVQPDGPPRRWDVLAPGDERREYLEKTLRYAGIAFADELDLKSLGDLAETPDPAGWARAVSGALSLSNTPDSARAGTMEMLRILAAGPPAP